MLIILPATANLYISMLTIFYCNSLEVHQCVNPLDAKLFFQTPVGARLIFNMLLLGAELIFDKLPSGAGLFFESEKRRDPSRAFIPVTK